MSFRVWKQRQRRVASAQQRLAGSVEVWSAGLVEAVETAGLLDRSWHGSVPDLLRSFGVMLDHRLFDLQEAVQAREARALEAQRLRRRRDDFVFTVRNVAKRHRKVLRGLAGEGMERMVCGEGRTPRHASRLVPWVEAYLRRIASSDMRKVLEECQKSAFDWDQLAREMEPPLGRLYQCTRDLKLAEQQETEAVWQKHVALASLDSIQGAVDRILDGVAMLAEG